SSPFYLNTETRPWIAENGNHPRRAGVSAFGFGGTNFHVVLEEYTKAPQSGVKQYLGPRPVEVFLLQRADREALLAALHQLRGELTAAEGGDLAELAGALFADEESGGLQSSVCRLALVAGSVADLRQKIEKTIGLLPGRATVNDPSGIYYSEAMPV